MPDAGEPFVKLSARRRLILNWAGLGAVSGLGATLSIFVFEWTDLFREKEFSLGPLDISVSPLTLGPGLVFGLIVGFALHRRGLVGGWRYPAYTIAAALSYFIAVHFFLNFLESEYPVFSALARVGIGPIASIGVAAGLAGAGLLTAFSAALMPVFRRWQPCLSMVVAGAVLGVLIHAPLLLEGSFLAWLALFAPWQAGYAAAMATALGRR